jgi:hypothetical protein
MTRITVRLAAFILYLSAITLAQTVNPDSLSNGIANLSAPESPAFTVLGLTPQKVVRPGSPQELATGLLNGFDERGNFQTGVAIDTAPFMLFNGDRFTLDDYRKGKFNIDRFLSRLQTSFATTKGVSNNDNAVRMALGFRVTFWDLGDPRGDLDLQQCNQNVQFPPPPPVLPITDEQKAARNRAILAAVEPQLDKCRDEAAKRDWNKSSFIVAGAPSWISADGTSQNFALNGWGVWSSLAYGFDHSKLLKNNFQLIAHARYRSGETVPDKNISAGFIQQDAFATGGSVRFGAATFNGAFEGLYNHTRSLGVTKESFSYSFAVEKQLSSGLWFNASLNRNNATPSSSQNVSLLSGIKWVLTPKPKLQLP